MGEILLDLLPKRGRGLFGDEQGDALALLHKVFDEHQADKCFAEADAVAKKDAVVRRQFL